jgi:3-hydroxyphenylacetate 6-hydroxylase
MHGHAIWVSHVANTLLKTHPLSDLRTNKPIDPDVWTDPEEFRPERWLEQPDAPIFTYGLGYRMCAGSLLANRELYLVFMRTLNSFRIEPHDNTDWHPVRGNSDPASLVAIPQKYKVRFVPKDAAALKKVTALS